MDDTTEPFDLDAVAAEAEHRKFVFTYGGRQWSMLHVRDFDWKITRDGAISGDVEAINTAFNYALGDQAADFEALPRSADVTVQLFDQWVKHSGLSRGKSQSLTPSSPTTAKRSRRVSQPTTPA